jgi:two-component system, NarL family, response regulator
MTALTIRVVLVDDHALVREGIASLLSGEPGISVVGSVSTGKQAIFECAALKPDVVLLDMRMPDMDGLATLQALKEQDRSIVVLILSSHIGDESIFRALKAGAAGYISKSAQPDELVAAIRRGRVGRVMPQADVAASLAEREFTVTLSPREVNVLERIAQGQSNKRVAQGLGLTEGTVKNYVAKLIEKLGASDRTHAVTIAVQRGFIHLDD